MAAVIATLFTAVIFVTSIPALVATAGVIDSMNEFGIVRGFKIFVRDNRDFSIMGAVFYVSVVLAWVIYMETTHGIQW